MNSARSEHKPIPPTVEPRVLLFTDTLGDVNGVSRFINDIADQARKTGRPLHVFTSTRFPVRRLPDLHNFSPLFASCMPGYPDLEVTFPPFFRMLREARRFNPHAVHISTPGPVGLIGRIAARLLRVPLVGVYHTDFPSYADKLFDDEAISWLARRAMTGFYKPFHTIFTRSHAYAQSLDQLHIGNGRCVPLQPGTRTDRFSPHLRDAAFLTTLGIPADSVKVLYVGRLSIEKNIPMLTELWRRCFPFFRAQRLNAHLIIVGDGPYRAEMQSDLPSMNCHFTGFRSGDELSVLYASSDFFVFPSITDTLGQVVLEAQSSGLPAIVTDIGGPKETVRHNETGFVLPATDLDAWSQRILQLASNPDLRHRLGRAARERMEHFSIADSFEHFWSVHRNARPDLFPDAYSSLPQPPASNSENVASHSPEACTLPT